jgi:hypothetical protein
MVGWKDPLREASSYNPPPLKGMVAREDPLRQRQAIALLTGAAHPTMPSLSGLPRLQHDKKGYNVRGLGTPT